MQRIHGQRGVPAYIELLLPSEREEGGREKQRERTDLKLCRKIMRLVSDLERSALNPPSEKPETQAPCSWTAKADFTQSKNPEHRHSKTQNPIEQLSNHEDKWHQDRTRLTAEADKANSHSVRALERRHGASAFNRKPQNPKPYKPHKPYQP